MLEQEFLSTQEPPAAKRRIHWIIPAAIAVIVVLSFIFYFRNFYQVDSRDSVDSRESLVDSQQPVISTQNSELKTQNSKLKTQHSELFSVSEGKRLFQLAREVYGNPFLWVLIYKENQDKIPDPDMLLSGTTLVIPPLEGKPGKLTGNDSLEIAEGYRLAYEFYKVNGDPKADDFYLGFKKYSR